MFCASNEVVCAILCCTRLEYSRKQPQQHKNILPIYILCKKRRKKKKHTHEGEVRFVDLGDSVVAGVEVGGVFGKGGYAVELQVIAVDRPSEARAQQASGHTWGTWGKRSKEESKNISERS